MNRKPSLKTAALAAFLLSSPSVYAGGEVWSYEGDTGPDKWGELAPAWVICSAGHYQSPINIEDGIRVELPPLSADIKSSELKFGLDGPTFAVPYDPGSALTINDTRYELKQFHFHHQSEHTVNGKHYPMEAHLVLRAEGSDHNNAVMGILIEEGSENEMLNQFWDQLPRGRSTMDATESVSVNVGDLLPENRAYYMYEGSMTTPGCPQGVRWYVLEQPVQASKVQIDRFIEDLTAGKTNNRPVQPSYGRWVLKSR